MPGDTDKWIRIKAAATRLHAPSAPASENDEGDTEPTPPHATPEEGGQPAPDESQGKDVGGALRAAGAAIVPQGLVERVANAPTPGDLTPLLILLVFFLFAIVPVGDNNSTRLQLIWRAMTGGVKWKVPSAKSQIRAAQAAQDNPVAVEIQAVEEAAWGAFWGAGVPGDVADAAGGLLL